MSNAPKTPKQSQRNPIKRDEGLGKPGADLEEDEALIADRDNARTSDRTDARDGVDNSDTLPRDPDAAGGKSA